jgi:hypothetical protein
VLEGAIRSQVNDGPVTTYKAGQSFSELPGDRHGVSANASNGLGQIRHDITDLQTAQQALFDKMSEPPPRPAAAPTTKPAPRPSQAPPVR